jgi:adenosine deaminase
LGLPISLSTDDEGIFETDINHECEIAINDTDITYIELKQMAFNSIQTSFASVDDKKILLELLSKKFMVFENNLRRNE